MHIFLKNRKQLHKGSGTSHDVRISHVMSDISNRNPI